jgi:hypothetical protein
MTCLDDRRLVDVQFGGGTASERAHAHGCRACAARLARLADDLARIDAVLRTTSPRRAAPAWRWAPLAVAAVLAVVVAVRQLSTPPPVQTADVDVATLADELTDALTADVTFNDATTSTTADRSTCPWGDPLLGVGCDEAAVLQIAWR